MSHVDEGRLSEYLDRRIEGSSDRGEIERHLAECAECRERLEEVRAIRERAAHLLSVATPAQVAMPQFAEIEARARARRAPQRVLAMRRLTALGWAATIVLAVGVGWLARGSFGFGGSQSEPLANRATAAAAETAKAAGQDSPVSTDAAGRAPEGGAAFSQTAPAPQVAEAVERDAAPAAAARQAPNLAAAPAPEPRRAEPQVPALGNVAEREQPAAAAKVEAAEGIRTRQAVAGVVAAAEERPDALGRGDVVVDSAANELLERADEALRAKSWTGTTAQDAARHLGGPLHTVDGLPIESIRIGHVDGAPAVTVVQILPGGEQLEIVQWRSGDVESREEQLRMAEEAARAQAPAAPTAGVRRSELVATRDGLVLVIRAAIASDSLAVLAGSVR
jgi:hypothetical protein